MDAQRFNAERILRICRECATMVWRVQLSPVGIEATARLLFGTAAQESSLEWERQRSPKYDGPVGGFSKWQLESGSISESVQLLRRDNELCYRATQFLYHDSRAPISWVQKTDIVPSIQWAMTLNDNDHLGALFCRLHYMRVPIGIPCDLADQAAYWKRHYNTILGAGTVEQYVNNWTRLCAPVLGENK